ncbi:MAG: 50S ribosomal protein L21 [Chloroflexi bacterium]|nr:50S ribosomal protein L21 [Chloroflexota bacterium]
MTDDYAIINTGGKQYRVREGDTVQIEKLIGEPGDSVTFDRVLLTSLNGEVEIGKPAVGGAEVTAEIASQDKARKVISFRYKNKTRQHVKTGHRQKLTSVRITAIKGS